MQETISLNLPVSTFSGSSGSARRSLPQQIMSAALSFSLIMALRARGIDEITNARRHCKGTFYLYFKSKKELLINCVLESLTTIVVPKEVWEDIRREKRLCLEARKKACRRSLEKLSQLSAASSTCSSPVFKVMIPFGEKKQAIHTRCW